MDQSRVLKNCSICDKAIVSLSSHMIQVHGVRLKQLHGNQRVPHKDSKLAEQVDSFKSPSCPFTDKAEIVPETSMSNARASEYLQRIQEFMMLNTHQRRQYIKLRSPDAFIKMLRECIINILGGVVDCNKTTVSSMQAHYIYRRIASNHPSNKEVRLYLCNKKVIELLVEALPSVIEYFSSFQV